MSSYCGSHGKSTTPIELWVSRFVVLCFIDRKEMLLELVIRIGPEIESDRGCDWKTRRRVVCVCGLCKKALNAGRRGREGWRLKLMGSDG